MANLDPLHILNADLDSKIPPELKLDYYNWTDADLSREFNLSSGLLPKFMGTVKGDKMTLGQIIEELKKMYCEWRCTRLCTP
jgi:2-oxoglutarate dehydrogenase E1 component